MADRLDLTSQLPREDEEVAAVEEAVEVEQEAVVEAIEEVAAVEEEHLEEELSSLKLFLVKVSVKCSETSTR